MILLSVAILFRRVHYAHEYCREGMHVHNYVFHCDFTYPYVLRTNVILLARDPLDPFMNMRGSFLCARSQSETVPFSHRFLESGENWCCSSHFWSLFGSTTHLKQIPAPQSEDPKYYDLTFWRRGTWGNRYPTTANFLNILRKLFLWPQTDL